jgi:hypothetical protein
MSTNETLLDSLSQKAVVCGHEVGRKELDSLTHFLSIFLGMLYASKNGNIAAFMLQRHRRI